MIHAQRQTFDRYLSAVRLQREINQNVVAEIIGIRLHGAEKFRVLQPGE